MYRKVLCEQKAFISLGGYCKRMAVKKGRIMLLPFLAFLYQMLEVWIVFNPFKLIYYD